MTRYHGSTTRILVVGILSGITGYVWLGVPAWAALLAGVIPAFVTESLFLTVLDRRKTNTMSNVELHEAFYWTCDECGEGQFVHAVTVERETLEREGLMEEIQQVLGDNIEGTFLMAPSKVTCQRCGRIFTVEHS